MKHRKRRKGSAERFLSILLAAVMVLSLAPENMLTLAVYAEGTDAGLCEHHRSHTADCGYREAAPCAHEHTDECYTEKTSCIHVHDADCYGGELPAEGEDRKADDCTHVCTEDSGCVTKELNCTHEHDRSCGYAKTAPCGYVCKICPVQELVDALPDAEEITAENAADVEKQLVGIDEAKAELTDEEPDALDITKYEAAVSALLALENMEGADQIKTLEGTGVFTVTGGTLDTDYTYADGVLTVKNNADITISMTDGVTQTTADRILVENGANVNITLSGVNIDVSGTDEAAAFQIADDSTGNVTVTLEGTNVLKSGADCAGLQKNGGDGTLTIDGTGSLTAQGGDQAAGIGGGKGGSGTGICITGGTIKAYGGSTKAYSEDGNSAPGNFGGAGIGGGLGGSGTVTISGDADVTAQGAAGAAGIGAGRCSSIGAGAKGTVTIEGGTVIATGGLTPGFSGNSGAGIGAGQSSHAEVTITGGTVTATGGSSGRGMGKGGAGIGGSGSFGNATVKISGGTVTAKGGEDENGGAGIGGGSGYNANITITGGVVTATGGSDVSSDGSGKPGAGIGLNGSGSGSATFSTDSGNAFIIATGGTGANINGDGITGGDNTSGWSGIIFNGDEGQVYGSQTLTANAEIPAGKNLTIPSGATLTVNSTLTNEGALTIDGGTLSGTDTLGGSGSFFTTELTEEMITVPTGLFYNGSDRIDYIEQNTKLATKTYCGKAFEVTGWTQSVTKVNDLEYTVTYTPDSGVVGTAAITKTVTLAQSGTQFGDGSVKAYNGDTETTEFTYGETITVKAIPTATGQAPTAARSRLRGLNPPDRGQMAVYCGGTQVSDAAGADGSYTMTVSVKDIIAAGAQYNQETALTAKFVENDYMADGTGTVTVTLKPATLTITGATLDAKTYDGTKTGTVSSVDFTGVVIGDTLTLGTDYTATAEFADANAGENKNVTVTVTLINGNYIFADGKKEAAYTLNGQAISPKTVTNASVSVSGTYAYTGEAVVPPAVAVRVTYTDNGETVTIPSDQYTFICSNNISVGTAVIAFENVSDGNYTVSGTGNFAISPASLSGAAVTVGGSYTYDGTAQTPDSENVTVTLNGKTLTAGTDYTFAVTDNVNAGAIAVTVTGTGSYKDTATGTFTIARAPLIITAKDQGITYGGSIAQGTNQVDVSGRLVSGHTLESVILTASSSEVEAENKTITPSGAAIRNSGTDVTANYDITYAAGRLTIEYLDQNEVTVTFNGTELADTPWFSPAARVTIAAAGFAIAAADGTRPAAGEITESSITIPAGEVSGKTFYFKQTGTGYMTDGIRYTTLKVDNNPPTGSIGLNYKLWDKFLSVISFGHYQATDQTVTITADDNNGSGIGSSGIEYAIVTGGTKYASVDEVKAANLTWTSYDPGNKPAVSVNTASVIYARLTDAVGNTAYISSEGILLDETAPTVSGFNTVADSVKDRQAQVSLTVDEAATVYLVAVPKTEGASGSVQAADVIATCDKNAIGAAGGAAISGAAWHGTLAADGENLTGTADLTGLVPFTRYTVYAAAVDQVIDMDRTASDSSPVYTGNVSAVESREFITAKENLRGKLSLSGAAVYGQQLTAEAAIDPDVYDPGDIRYQWYRVKDGAEVPISGAASDIYVLTKEEIGCIIRVAAATSRCDGRITADTAPVQKADCPAGHNPADGRVNDEKGTDTFTFTGRADITYEYSLDGGSTWADVDGSMLETDGSGDSGSSGDGRVAGTISIGNAALAEGKVQIRAKETEIYRAGPALSNDEPFTAVLEGSVSLTGTAMYGETLAAVAEGTQAGAVLTYRFYRTVPGEESGTPVQEGKGSTYTVRAEDIGCSIHVKVTAADHVGELESGRTGMVRKAPQTLTVPRTAYTRTYGDESFPLGCTTDGSGRISYTVSGSQNAAGEAVADTGILTVSEDGTVTIRRAGSATVTATLADGPCHEGTDSRDITVTVNKAQNAPGQPETEIKVPYSCSTVGGAALPEGWEWQASDREKALETGTAVSAVAVYAGADRENYENGTVTVRITRAECSHAVTEVRNAKEASCTGTGYTGDTYCTDCGVKTASGQVTAALGHSWDGGTVTKEPTADAEGEKTYACTVCGATRTESIPAEPESGDGEDDHSHSYDSSVTKEASCTESGVMTHTCACGDSYTETIPAPGHDYRGSVTKQPTTAEEGTMTYTCARCGHSYTRPVAKLPGKGQNNGNGNGNGSGSNANGDQSSGGQSGSGNANAGRGGNSVSAPQTAQPFLKDESGKEGWDVIRAETEKAEEGRLVTVEMNGSVAVPGSVLETVKGKDVNVVFDMDSGMSWSVNGRSVTAEHVGDIDFSAETGKDHIPADLLGSVAGENYSVRLSLAYEGEFGFTAVLSVSLGRENGGRYAALYYYNEAESRMEFVCEDRIAEDGTAQFPFTHASEYAIVVDEEPVQEGGTGSSIAAASAAGEESAPGEAPEAARQETGAAWKPWLFAVIGAAVIALGIAAWLILGRKKEDR